MTDCLQIKSMIHNLILKSASHRCHTHLQFAKATAQVKIAKEYATSLSIPPKKLKL